MNEHLNSHDPSSAKQNQSTCEIVCDLLPLYVEQLASPASVSLIESHLQNCPECQKQFKVLQEPEPELEAPDLPMQEALSATHKKFFRNRVVVWCLAVLCLLLAGGGLVVFWNQAHLHASNITIAKVTKSDQQTILLLGNASEGNGFAKMSVTSKGEGEYSLSILGGSGWLNQKPVEMAILSNPVHSVEVEGDVIYQDGEIITAQCRYFFPDTNGNSADIERMWRFSPALSSAEPGERPDLRADTNNPKDWVWILPDNSYDSMDHWQYQTIQKQSLLALALTPGLESISLKAEHGGTHIVASRGELDRLLEEHNVKGKIETYADLQKILNLIYPEEGYDWSAQYHA